jgi:hypothetical protein
VHSDLPLEWWERADECKDAKAAHTARIDHMCDSREGLVLKTTLWKEDTVLEPNMFPCKCMQPISTACVLWDKTCSVARFGLMILVVMFSDWTPRGVDHYTLWSIHELQHHEVS